ncbi:MAG: phosphonate ABC transporter permease [Rhodospirillales bacterium 70-18]|nr:ABC transporter permease subunit [Rhodospirillales bacterium]OJY73565.1 MAG: phosphonate ABC transporter permease [Rhodospirillales bacterium 70-18]
MLLWSAAARSTAWTVLGLLLLLVYGVPLGLILLASLTGQWNGVLPSHMTLSHLAGTLRAEPAAQLRASVLTGLAASLAALAFGTWAALALRRVRGGARRWLELVFFLPSALPSISVGLGLLVAFSRPPLLLNGTVWIVLAAHFVMVSAFAYGMVAAGLAQLPAELEQIAESLGAGPLYRLRRITLPLLAPQLLAAFSLGFALSMGELGATVMVYPPSWVTLPVGIFGLSDRGAVFDAAALTVLLAAGTVAVLAGAARLQRLAGGK